MIPEENNKYFSNISYGKIITSDGNVTKIVVSTNFTTLSIIPIIYIFTN